MYELKVIAELYYVYYHDPKYGEVLIAEAETRSWAEHIVKSLDFYTKFKETF